MNSIKKNFFYNAIYQITILIFPLLTSPYISRIMGANKIGIYSYSYSIASYFGMFILLGLNNYGNRTIASVNNKEKISKTFWNIYYMQLFSGILVIFIYNLYVYLFANNKAIAMIQAFYLFSVMIDISWFFFGIEKFKITVTGNIVVKILSIASIFIFVKSSSHLYRYTFIMVASPVISQFFLWLCLKQYIKFEKPNFSEILHHVKPNLMLFIPVVAVSLYTSMAKIILGFLSNLTEVGYFESAYKVTSIPVMAITALGTVMLPRVSNMIANGESSKVDVYLQKSLKLSVFLSISMSLGLICITNEFVPMFYGKGFDKCKELIPVLVLSSIFISWANVIRTQYLIPYKKDKIYIQSVFLGAIINITTNILLIPSFKSSGAAIGTLLAEITVCVYQTFRVRKELKISVYLRQSVPFVIAGLIMYFIVIKIPYIYSNLITILLKSFSGCLIYFTMSIIFLFIQKYLKSYFDKKNIN